MNKGRRKGSARVLEEAADISMNLGADQISSLDGERARLNVAADRSKTIESSTRTAVLVLGMHRSGTSSVAGALIRLGGAAPLTLMPPHETQNPRGFWESIVLVGLNDEVLAAGGSHWDDWREFDPKRIDAAATVAFRARAKLALSGEFGDASLAIVKDPRMCRLLPFWSSVFHEAEWSVRPVLVLRSPLEVALSLNRRDDVALTRGCLIWLRHILDAEAETRQMRRAVLHWNDFLADRRGALERLGAQLDVAWPRWSDSVLAEIDEFVSADLKHQSSTEEDLRVHPAVSALVRDAHAATIELAEDPSNARTWRKLDEARARFEDAAAIFGQAMFETEEETRRLQSLAKHEREEHVRGLVALHDGLAPEFEAARHEFASQLATDRGEVAMSLAERDARLAEKDALIAEKDALIAEKDGLIADKKALIAECDARLADKDALVAEQPDARLADKDALIAERDARLADKRGVIAEKDAIIVNREAAIAEKNIASADYRRQIRSMEALLVEREARLAEKDSRLASQSKRIEALHSDVERLSAILERAEQIIAYVAERYTGVLAKRSFRKLRHALKVRFFRLPVPTSRYSLIRNSVFFDQNYYLSSNPDVKAAKSDAAVHYLQFGGHDCRDPGPQFSEAEYRALSPDVVATSLSALEHYERHGRSEGRRLLAPGPPLDRWPGPNDSATSATKSSTTQTLQQTGMQPDPAVLRQSLERSGLFDPAAYLGLNEDVRLARVDPWAHFLGRGIHEGRQFTTPDLVARALSRLAPDIQDAMLQVNERLSGPAGEDEIQKAAEPLVISGVNVGIYCNSLGNFFLQELANVVYWQLKAFGIHTQLRTEESDLEESFDIRIFIAPHEFFLLGRGDKWRGLAGAPGSILYNTEQVQTSWFCSAIPYLVRAPLVLDLNFQTAILLRQLGCNSIHYMPPYLPACKYTSPQPDVSHIEVVRGYDFSRKPFDWTVNSQLAERPIDILFVGTACERRLRAIESLRELTDKYRFFCICTHQTSPLNDANSQTRSIGLRNAEALAQRSKILLNIHRDWIGYFEWPRMVLQGFWQGACVVSDPSFADPVFASGEHFLEEATRHLPELLRWLLGTREGQTKMSEIAAAGYQRAASPAARAAMLLPMLRALQEMAGG
jgi:hypothetical protein